jgi:Flp pilus assembly protein protease CpaA
MSSLLYAGLTLWLLPCAIQDRRDHRVSPWLTLPLFFLAWPASLLLNTWPLTFATFIGFYTAFHLTHGGLGGADGKVATAIAAIAPPALLAGMAVNGLAFLYWRLRGCPAARLPGVVGFYLGVVLTSVYLFTAGVMKL